MSLCRNNLAPALVALLCGAFSAASSAAEYSMRAIVDQTAFYNGNLAMFPDPASANQELRDKYASGYELAPQLNLRAQSPRWNLDLTTKLSFSRLSDQLFDSDDQLVDLDYSYSGDTTRWDLSASVDRSSTRTSVEELGSILAAIRVERYEFSPRWTRTLSERNAIALGGTGSKVDYDQGRFNDYEYYSLEATWLRQLSEKNRLTLSVYDSRFESDGVGFSRESDTVGLRISLDREVNQALSTSISLGVRQVDTTTEQLVCFFIFCQSVLSEDDSNGVTAAAGVEYEAPGWQLSASASRSLVPNGREGGLLESDTVHFRYSRPLRESLTFDFIGRFSSEDELDTSAFKRDRLRLEPRLRWRFAERWSLLSSLLYRSRDQQRLGVDDDADGMTIFFRVRYRHPRNQW